MLVWLLYTYFTPIVKGCFIQKAFSYLALEVSSKCFFFFSYEAIITGTLFLNLVSMIHKHVFRVHCIAITDWWISYIAIWIDV